LTAREKNGFVTATKLGTTNEFFVALTKNFAAATKRLVDRTKHFVVVTKKFVIPILTNDFVGISKPFFPWSVQWRQVPNPLPLSDAVRQQKKNLEDLFSSVLSRFKKYHPSGNLKFNNLGIFQSLKLRILME